MNEKEVVAAEVFPAGSFLREELDERGWSDAEFAQILGRPAQAVSEIINGKKEITAETAVAIADALGTSAEYWLNLQSAFRIREVKARRSPNNSVVRLARLREKVPLRELRKRGWIRDTDDIDGLESEVVELLRPLEVADFAAAARKTDADVPFTPEQRAWLARVVQRAASRDVKPFDRVALIELANDLRRLQPDELPGLEQRLWGCGVVLVVEAQLPGSKLDGASIRTLSGASIIGMTTRGDRFDIFVWTLLHEIAHLVLGHVDIASIRLDEDLGAGEESVKEKEANDQADRWLFPDGFTTPPPPYSMASVVRAASSYGVHFSLLAGRLQHLGVVNPAQFRRALPRVRPFLPMEDSK